VTTASSSPAVCFEDLGVRPEVVARLRAHGIDSAFPIQEAAIPDALAGRDVCGRAPTGSGKTLAFGIAIVAAARKSAPFKPKGLVLAPTRELASQIEREVAVISGDARRVISIYGGTSYGPTQRSLSKGVDVVVACPGRLEDLLSQRSVDLSAVEVVVVDEADRMADMGFLPAVRRILDLTPDGRQVLLFSATLGPEVESLVTEYQHDPARHDVTPEAAPVEVAHHFWMTAREERVALTARLVGHHGQALVFCRTRHGVDRLARALKAVGIEAAAIHGDRTQKQRDNALQAFSRGHASALVATDVAARGIHVEALPCVVHYDLPADATDYLHRSGRTGRAGKPGTVVALVVSDQKRVARTLQRKLGLGEPTPAPALASLPLVRIPRESAAKRHSGSIPRTDRTNRTDRTARTERTASEERGERSDRPARRTDERPGRPRDDWSAGGRTDRPARIQDYRSLLGERATRLRQEWIASDRPSRNRDGWTASSERPARSRDEWQPRGDREVARIERPARVRDERPARARDERPARFDRPPVARKRGFGSPVGTVKFFNEAKGFGFLEWADGDDMFVHYSNIETAGAKVLRVGQRVSFDVGAGRKGAEAHNVRVV
jgi:superfamily II DNA/RNA helicase/cold shock CspA family protein